MVSPACANSTADLQPFLELAAAFDRRLAQAVVDHPAIDPAAVRAILPDPLEVLESVRDLPVLEALDDRARAIPVIAERYRALEAKADAAKLGGRHRWGVWTDAQWHATPRELAARGDRYSHPEQWGWIGDQMFALAAYLSPRVAGQRHRFRKHLTLLADRPYKRDVLALTADLITRRHWLIFVSWQIRPLTAAEVKRRIIKRRPRP